MAERACNFFELTVCTVQTQHHIQLVARDSGARPAFVPMQAPQQMVMMPPPAPQYQTQQQYYAANPQQQYVQPQPVYVQPQGYPQGQVVYMAPQQQKCASASVLNENST